MNKYLYYIFTSISFALLIAAPGRFAFGLVLCFELFFLIITGFLFSFILKRFQLNEMNSIITVIGLVFSTVLYKQIIMLLFPIIALQLSFVFYLPAVTSYMIGIVYKNVNSSTKISLVENLKITMFFTVLALIFYLLRDVIGYGTITIPSAYGISEYAVFPPDFFSCGILFTSIPGSLVLVSVAILVFVFIQNKFNIIERAGDSNDSE